MKKPRRVALLIETSRAYGRGLLGGAAQYAREHGHWYTYFTPLGLDEPPPTWLKKWRGDGILARIDTRWMARVVLRLGIPTIDLRGTFPDLGLTPFGSDNRAVAEVAFRHFTDCGLQNFGFYGPPFSRNPYDIERVECFLRLAACLVKPILGCVNGHCSAT